MCSASLVFGLDNPLDSSRPASASEIQQLFELATRQPKQMHILADIKEIGLGWTKEQIAAELEQQTMIMSNSDVNLPKSKRIALLLTRSNIIASSHSGVKIKHVEEWYSGYKYRLDQTDESSVSTNYINRNRVGFHDTYVNVGDLTFSPYQSYSVNHELHDALLTKDPARLYAKNDLWRILSLDRQIALPIILTLADDASMASSKPHNGADRNFSLLRIDPKRMEILRTGSDPVWKLVANDELLDGLPVIKLRLTGQIIDVEAEQPSFIPIEVNYWLAQVSGKCMCPQASLTNITKHSSIYSTRKDYDVNGNPREWHTSTFKAGSPPQEFVCFASKVETGPTFTETAVFSPNFPTNYTVSDITFGTGILLQNPHPHGKAVMDIKPSRSRLIIVLLLALTTLGPIIAILAVRRSKNNQ